MDELIFLIDSYVVTTRQPSYVGLMFYLHKNSDMDWKDGELSSKLHLYLRWLEEDERYEECTYVQQIIKENEIRTI